MTMPRRLVQVRHGQSEANVVQRELLPDLDPAVAAEIMNRPDWEQRLSPLGIEQATIAGDWIRHHIGALASFDVIYVSPFMRTFETACYAAGDEDVQFTPEDRIIERDWGLYGKLSKADQKHFYPETYRHKKENPLYARLDGGESQMDSYLQIRDINGTMHREYPSGKVLMFGHGDKLAMYRYVLERMLPEEWVKMVQDSFFDIRNCTVIDWTRDNPGDPGDVREKINWMRIVHPTAPGLSPFGGEWVELTRKRTYTVGEGLARVATSPTLLPDGLLDRLRQIEAGKAADDMGRFRQEGRI
jgi:broad specificity phosphatase PhoE